MKLSSLVSSGMLMKFNGVPLYAFEGDSLLHKIAKNSLNDKVLVLIEMHGGNDGLNTVIPINQYGHSKLQAERFVLEYSSNALILRTNFFGYARGEGKSLLNFALKALDSDKQIVGFADVFFSPVGASEIANFLLDESSKGITGILNFASREVTSKFDFLVLVSRILGYSDRHISRGSIVNSELTAQRPSYLALDSTRLLSEIGYDLPSLEAMLRIELNYAN